jgi:multiple sugar transport system substrate-binding protein
LSLQSSIPEKAYKARFTLLACSLLFAVLAASCTETKKRDGQNLFGNESSEAPGTEHGNREPLKLRVLDMSRMPADTFRTVVSEPVLKRHPRLTVVALPYPDNAEWEKIIATEPADLIFAPLTVIEAILDTEVLTDVQPVIKQMLDDEIAAMIRAGRLPKVPPDPLNGAERLLGTTGIYRLLPPGGGASLYYNKDLFDKFAVPYPQEGISWSQTMDLAVRLSRVEGSVQYRGFLADRSFILDKLSLQLPYLDPLTNRTNFGKDEWAKWLSVLQPFYEIPGGEAETEIRDTSKTRFLQKKDTAMWAGNFIYPPLPQQLFAGGRVTLPTFEVPAPNEHVLSTGHFFALPKTGKHPQEVLRAIGDIVSVRRVSKYESDAGAVLKKKFADVISGRKDLNSALREADEEIVLKQKADLGQ